MNSVYEIETRSEKDAAQKESGMNKRYDKENTYKKTESPDLMVLEGLASYFYWFVTVQESKGAIGHNEWWGRIPAGLAAWTASLAGLADQPGFAAVQGTGWSGRYG